MDSRPDTGRSPDGQPNGRTASPYDASRRGGGVKYYTAQSYRKLRKKYFLRSINGKDGHKLWWIVGRLCAKAEFLVRLECTSRSKWSRSTSHIYIRFILRQSLRQHREQADDPKCKNVGYYYLEIWAWAERQWESGKYLTADERHQSQQRAAVSAAAASPLLSSSSLPSPSLCSHSAPVTISMKLDNCKKNLVKDRV